jgi:hypothetical protein
MKEIYSFVVSKSEEVEKEEEKKRKNKDTKKMETVKVTSTVTEDVPYRISILEPSRRQTEDADMEFSVEMSRCIKKGILTKAMLAKKYSDTGGLLSEDDAIELTRLYGRLGELQNRFLKVESKPNKDKEDSKKSSVLTEDIGGLRRKIVDLESSYQALFNHTADVKAQNRSILWFMLNITKIRKDSDPVDESDDFFVGETPEAKEDYYYALEEDENELYEKAKPKLLSFISLWYFSANPERSDFESLEADIEESEKTIEESEKT